MLRGATALALALTLALTPTRRCRVDSEAGLVWDTTGAYVVLMLRGAAKLVLIRNILDQAS